MTKKYKANRGGHAPGHLRDIFLEAIDMRIWENSEEWCKNLDENSIFDSSELQNQWESLTPRNRGIWLMGQLWNCIDTMPSESCDTLGLSSGSTYAVGARELRKLMR